MSIVGVVDTPKIHVGIFMVVLLIPRAVLFLWEKAAAVLVAVTPVLILLPQCLPWLQQHLMLLLLLLHRMRSCLVRRLRHFISLLPLWILLLQSPLLHLLTQVPLPLLLMCLFLLPLTPLGHRFWRIPSYD